MLAVRTTPTRDRKTLDGLWRFCLDPDGSGRRRGWENGLPPEAREMPVPASYNDVFPEAAYRDHVGEVWYETSVRVPRSWAEERIVLRFGSATHRAVVWVNGTRVAEHEGGYTPFEADVTDVVEVGGPNRISVVVDNVLTWQSIPPGFVEDTPDGHRQKYFHDFFNYAGLHRSVWLYTTPRTYVEDITVVTGLSGTTGTIRYEVHVAGAVADVRTVLVDAGGTEVARGSGASGEVTVEAVRPWQPGEGYLYELTVELLGDADEPVDSYPLPVGIRSIEVRGNRFLVNGEPFYFRGFGMHEDHPLRGKGHDNVSMVHTSPCWTGSAPTRCAPRTTRTPRRSTSTPTGTASSSSTRPRPSGSTWASAGASSGPRASRPSPRRRSTTPPGRSTGRRSER
jgi:beta-glucuronidase